MARYIYPNDTDMKNAGQVTDMLNNMGFNYEGFAAAMSRQHKTLQQNFTRLCLEWLMTCASPDYQTDGRNEATKKIAQELAPIIKEKGLPYI